MKLWHEFSTGEQRRYDHHFKTNVNPVTLSTEEFIILCQWLFVMSHYTMESITPCAGSGCEIIMRAPDASAELLRLHHASPPFNALEELLASARHGTYKKLRLYTFGKFTAAQLKVQSEFPLLLELLDEQKIIGRLEDTRRLWQRSIAKPPTVSQAPEPYYTGPQPAQHYGHSTKREPRFLGLTSGQILTCGLIIILAMVLLLVATLVYLMLFVTVPV